MADYIYRCAHCGRTDSEYLVMCPYCLCRTITRRHLSSPEGSEAPISSPEGGRNGLQKEVR